MPRMMELSMSSTFLPCVCGGGGGRNGGVPRMIESSTSSTFLPCAWGEGEERGSAADDGVVHEQHVLALRREERRDSWSCPMHHHAGRQRAALNRSPPTHTNTHKHTHT